MPSAPPEKTGEKSSLAHTSWRHIWSISWPIFLANVTVPLVGAIDTAMMGRLPDPSYIGGVALGSLVFNFLYFGLGFLRMGTTGLVAQAHGANDESEIENLLIRSIFIALVIGFAILLLKPLILVVTEKLLTASDAVEVLMHSYVDIRLFATPAALANMALLGCLFGRQQMQLCMVQIIVVSLGNLGLNILFVVGFGMAIEGVALASVLAQWFGFAFTLGLIGWQWRDMLRGVLGRVISAKSTWFDMRAFGRFFILGVDLILRTLVLLGCEAILLNMAARIGDLELAAVQLIMVIFGMIAFALDGYAHAVEALVGEAIGRKDKQMMHIVVRRTNVMAGGSSLLISLVVLVGATPILMALTNQAELIELTLQYWHWVVVLPIASFLAFQMDGVFIGATRGRDMRNAMFVAAFVFGLMVWLARPYGLAGLLGAFTLYLAMRGVTLWMLMPRVYRLVDQHS